MKHLGAQMTKRAIEIEKLLHWAYRDELSKRRCSSAEGIWDKINEIGHNGGVDVGHGAAQRYSHFGLPHPDAERIEQAVGALQDVSSEVSGRLEDIAPDLAGLITINKPPTADTKATKSGWFNPKGQFVQHTNRPRDVIMVGSIKVAALVTMHAIRESRPDWWDEEPSPKMIHAQRGPKIEGECKGRNHYSTGSYCPLQWEPSPISVVQARAEYVAWFDGLEHLARTLLLEDFQPLPPVAPRSPWFSQPESIGRTISMPSLKQKALPLTPERPRTSAPMRRPQSSPGRRIAVA